MHGALQTRQATPGFFITFEGGEGAGKSTQITRLADKLRAAGHDVLVTREPGGSPGAEAVRHVLLSGAAEPFGPKMEAVLFAAARSDHVEQVIRPAVERGVIVLCDRFLDSTRVYQGVTGNLDPPFVEALEKVADQRHDARHDADPRPRSGARLAARHGAPRRGGGRPLREGGSGHPPAASRGLSGDRGGRARALHRHRRLERRRDGGDGDRGGGLCGASKRGPRPRPSRSRYSVSMYERIAPEQYDSLDGVPEPSEALQVFGHDASRGAAHRGAPCRQAAACAGVRRPARHRQGDHRIPAGALSAVASLAGHRACRIRAARSCRLRSTGRSPAARIPRCCI